ncbi:hypothetical protein [Paraburkholderia sediminicola]|uniref:hypothetical protein n=1 Tax=Paraburkholderia sediminicola TaxID=458836 RepID=UPI0038B98C7C
MKRTTLAQRASVTDTISYASYRFPPDAISYAVFSLSPRMVEGLVELTAVDYLFGSSVVILIR